MPITSMDTTKVVYTNPQNKSNLNTLRTASTSQPSQAIYQEDQDEYPQIVPLPVDTKRAE